jgi:pimeloyl-ACP methyl ester carboxylesterase
MTRIESLLSARQFLVPQKCGDKIYFISNLSGKLSLYAMDDRPGGSVPEPLLPPDIALQNPELMNGYAYKLFPKLGKILLMLDRDSDENYQPVIIPIGGGYPQPAFGDVFAGKRVYLMHTDVACGVVYFNADVHNSPLVEAFRADLKTGAVTKLAEDVHGCWVTAANASHTLVVMNKGYTSGDNVLELWRKRTGRREVLFGKPIEARAKGEVVPLNSIGATHFTEGDRGLLLTTSLFSDTYGLGYLNLKRPAEMKPVTITGARHSGMGELTGLDHLQGNTYSLHYNIDGCSWLYEGVFSESKLTMKLTRVIAGAGEIANGVMQHPSYHAESKTHLISYSTATSPTQIYAVATKLKQHTNEKLLGVSVDVLADGEDASFTSHDGLRILARLYLPAAKLKFKGPRPLVYYVHGGPQSQERPDFAWFSMPLIQFLTLNGFAVFVPNARGSSGYGLSYMKHVDRDWGGQDRLDHVYAMTKVLPKDKRVDVSRAAVIGRSYGGYMTLTLAARHPELWRAAVDMFGPYDLFTFIDRLPETWKTYFYLSVGHPQKDRDFLIERSPRTHIGNVRCPMLVIQGQNDPRVTERESRDVVEQLQAQGKPVEYLVFEDEGHDVLKFGNKVRCYNAITEFFLRNLS